MSEVWTGGLKVKIYVASPYRGETSEIVRRNVRYVLDICREIAYMGHYPFAPHLHDPQFLEDNVPKERAMGLASGKAWLEACDGVIFFIDRGMSDGMKGEMAFASKIDKPYVMGSLDNVRDAVEALDGVVTQYGSTTINRL